VARPHSVFRDLCFTTTIICGLPICLLDQQLRVGTQIMRLSRGIRVLRSHHCEDLSLEEIGDLFATWVMFSDRSRWAGIHTEDSYFCGPRVRTNLFLSLIALSRGGRPARGVSDCRPLAGCGTKNLFTQAGGDLAYERAKGSDVALARSPGSDSRPTHTGREPDSCWQCLPLR